MHPTPSSALISGAGSTKSVMCMGVCVCKTGQVGSESDLSWVLLPVFRRPPVLSQLAQSVISHQPFKEGHCPPQPLTAFPQLTRRARSLPAPTMTLPRRCAFLLIFPMALPVGCPCRVGRVGKSSSGEIWKREKLAGFSGAAGDGMVRPLWAKR